MSRPALVCALIAGALATTAVAGSRAGLALSAVTMLVMAAAALGSEQRVSRPVLLIGAGLAVQAVVLDAEWVVTLDVLGALVAAAAAVRPTRAWVAIAAPLVAPLRLVGGARLVGAASLEAVSARRGGQAASVLRGVALAVIVGGVFGALFVSADTAFAELTEDVVSVQFDAPDLIWRLWVGVLAVAVAGALVKAGRPDPREPGTGGGPVPGRVELLIVLTALVALFAAFVAVQLRVMFGGASYVQQTTGLGYGEYARQGFVLLLIVAALTLAVIAAAARRRDRSIRLLLAALCVLTLVVLASAHHRLYLVEDVYGFTRVRYAGHAVVIWLAAVFALVLAAGARLRVARAAPRAAVVMTLAGVLAFSLTNPDARIASLAVDRFNDTGLIDPWYMSGLSADALPALDRLPDPQRQMIVPEIRAGLSRADGIGEFNISRARARGRPAPEYGRATVQRVAMTEPQRGTSVARSHSHRTVDVFHSRRE